MSGDVEFTENDFRIALRALMLQSKVHGVPFTWETRSFILHMAEVRAAEAAMGRFQQNAIHAMTIRNAA